MGCTRMPSDDDPFADPTHEATAVSPADTIRVPESVHIDFFVYNFII